MNLVRRVSSIFEKLQELEWLPILIVRLAEGYMFATSGWGKLGKLHEFTAYFESLGIPLASLQAPFVATLELVGGAALVVGFGTRIFSALLAGTMAVAILTARLQEASVKTAGDFFYLQEWLLLLLLVWLVFSGPGKVSVDAKLKRRSQER